VTLPDTVKLAIDVLLGAHELGPAPFLLPSLLLPAQVAEAEKPGQP
jgi:hypothetical protein